MQPIQPYSFSRPSIRQFSICPDYVPVAPPRTSFGGMVKKALGVVARYGTVGSLYGAAATGLCAQMGIGAATIGTLTALTGLAPVAAGAALGAAAFIGARALSRTLGRTLAIAPPVIAGGALLVSAIGWEPLAVAAGLAGFFGMLPNETRIISPTLQSLPRINEDPCPSCAVGGCRGRRPIAMAPKPFY